MRKTNRLGWKNKTAVLALGLGLFVWGFIMMAIVSHAESQVKVTSPKGANIRKEASSSSERVGGVEKDSVLTVLNQVQGSDGYTWYQVKSGDTTGYIRSDLVEVSEGGTAPSEGGTEGGEGGSGEGAAPVDVMAVNPVSATVSSDSGKIRDTASSEGQILEEVPAETVLTVNGQATDADGRTWYQVSFLSGETEVKGFIRYDYVTLAGELTPLTEEPSDPAPEEPSEPEPSEEEKLYETALQYAGLTGRETVWDLYCGIGTISLFLAQRAGKVYGVESVPQAIEDARKNAAQNGIVNAEFFEGKAEDVLPQFYQSEDADVDALPPDVIVVDPPRKGCDERCLEAMIQMRPERIVYVSCDPATLARDLKILCDGGYELKRGRVVDQFCHTVHVETIVLIQKKTS